MKIAVLLAVCLLLTSCSSNTTPIVLSHSANTMPPTSTTRTASTTPLVTPSPSAMEATTKAPNAVDYALIRPIHLHDLGVDLRARYTADIKKHTLYPSTLKSYSPLINGGVVFIDRDDPTGETIQYEFFSDGSDLMTPKFIPDASFPRIGSVIALRADIADPRSIAWVEHNQFTWRLVTSGDYGEIIEIDSGEIVDEYIPVMEMHYVKGVRDGFGYYTCEDSDGVRQWKANLCFYPYNEAIEIDVEMTDTPETGIPFTGSGYVALPDTRDDETTAKVYWAQLSGIDAVMAPKVEEIIEIIIPDNSPVVNSIYHEARNLSYFIWQNTEDVLYGFTPGTSGYHVFEPLVKHIVPANHTVSAVAKDGRALFLIDFMDQLRMIEIYSCDDGEEIVGVMFSQPTGSIYMLMDTADGLQVYEQQLPEHTPLGGE